MHLPTTDFTVLDLGIERAKAPVFWPVRLRQRLNLPGVFGIVVAASFLGTFFLAAGGGWPTAETVRLEDIGHALFFALSLGLILELAATIPLAAQRDMDALSAELTIDEEDRSRLRLALVRYPGRDTAVNAGVGAVIGVGHVALTSPGWTGLAGDPVDTVLALGTVMLWALMVQTGVVLVTNAFMFSNLTRHATKVEIHALDRLRTFGTAALRPMLLIMALLAAYPLMLLGAGTTGVSTAIGPVATVLLALAVVWLPLRGLAERIRDARATRLVQLDSAISEVAQIVDRHGAPREPARLEALLSLRARAQATSSLPIGLSGLARGLIYLALPVATWAGKGFGEALLSWLL
jgi:hypothetical protein